MMKSKAVEEYRRLVRREGAAPVLSEIQVVIESLGLTTNQVIEDINLLSQHTGASAKAECIEALRGEVEQAASHHALLDAQLAARRLKVHMSGSGFSTGDQEFQVRVHDAGRQLGVLQSRLDKAEQARQEIVELEARALRLFDPPTQKAKDGVNP